MNMEYNNYPIYECSLPEAKIAADLISICNDLQRIIDMLSEWLSIKEKPILSDAFLSSTLIIYRRCFNSGVRNGLTRDDIVNLHNDGALELHEYLYKQASKLVAHSVNPFEHTKIGIVISDKQEIVGNAFMSGRLNGFTDNDIKQFGSLVMLISNSILKPRIDDALKKTMDTVKNLPIGEITSSPILRYTAPGSDDSGTKR